MPVSLPLTGGCGCGAVRFEVDAPPVAAAHCHCSRCRRRSGTPGQASVRPQPGSVRLVQGEDRLGTWMLEDGLGKVFCSTCGSALFAVTREEREIAVVRYGAFDSDPGVRPSVHQFVDSAPAWAPVPDDGLPRYPGRLPA